MKSKPKRLYYIDLLNVIAILGVLFQHTAQIAHVGVPHQPTTIMAGVIQTICLPAVAIFFMNSGAMLLDYRERYNTEHFFKRRLFRVVVPLVIWSVFFYIYSYYFYAFPGIFHHGTLGIKDFVKAFLNNKINSLFWFFYIVIQLYLITPVISTLSAKNKKLLLYIATVAFITVDVFAYLDGLVHYNLATSWIKQPLLSSSWIQYFIMGYLIKERFFSHKVENIFIAFGLFTFTLNIINQLTVFKYTELNNISDFPYAVAIYLIVKRIASKECNEKVKRYMAILASTSLGIYILHPLVIEAFDHFVFHQTPANWGKYLLVLQNPVHIFILPFIIYIILVPFILLLQKNKFVKYIIP